MKKKLSKTARKKEATGINVEAAKKREVKLMSKIRKLESKVTELSEVIGHKFGDWYDSEILKDIEKLKKDLLLLVVHYAAKKRKGK
jgi:hypothetical protein